ncbi:MAG: capsular biosynthesis protein, partial [Epsilonproteobacteria bacterium]|nr:capsular biosynthesis protein [Campylobacterota bacterium]
MIFSFFKKKKSVKKDFLKVDIHSHIIPAIDDGAKNIDESITLLKSLEKIGYKKLITTPHIMSDAYTNSAQTIYEGLENLKYKMKEKNISIEIEAAAEYYLDEGFYK